MIFVTGATGHIGNVLVRELVSRGFKVRALVLAEENDHFLKKMGVECCEGDILDSDTLTGEIEGAEIVYHLAGVISIMPGKNEQVYRVNVEGTRNVVRACLKTRVKRLVYTSSIHAIKRIPAGTVVDERIPFETEQTAGAYDRSKALATLEVLEWVKQGLDAVIVCPTWVIGPYDFRYSEMARLILNCLKRKNQLYIDGAYDFVDVRDVVYGLIQACEKGKRGETYILSGEKISVKDLMNMVSEMGEVQFSRTSVPLWVAQFVAFFTPTFYRLSKTKPLITPYSLHTLRSNSDISHDKASRDLGYQNRSLRETIHDTIKWLKNDQLADRL